jgi:hypothetical protein
MRVAVAVRQILRVAQVGLVVVVSDMLTLLLVIKMQQPIQEAEAVEFVTHQVQWAEVHTFLVLAVQE